MALKIGHRLADYTIDAVLGGGGMGDVYKVTNRLTGGEDAAKLLKPELTSDPAQLDRFLQEIRTLARLNHENIVALRTALTVGEQLMMVMEYVDGDSLDKVRGRLRELEGVLGLTAQLLRALQYAHEKGIIHRDIKPQNIMVAMSGRAKVLDFGIAKIVQERRITPTGFMVGSPYYMAPEQIKGETLDARTDIYSLGIVLYEMITHKLPFDGATFYDIWHGHLHVTPIPPGDIVF
jgi:serine/threonine-protein kinase